MPHREYAHIIIDGIDIECRPGKKCGSEKERRLRRNANQQRWMQNNRHRAREIMLRHRQIANPTYRRREALKKYGMTINDYNVMYENQKGICPICKGKFSNGTVKGLVVDHCHQTGFVRGLLCSPCNQAIGMLKHSQEILNNAKEYLKHGL